MVWFYDFYDLMSTDSDDNIDLDYNSDVYSEYENDIVSEQETAPVVGPKAAPEPRLLSLLETSAKVAAKHLSCTDLEQWQTATAFDETSLQRIAYWAFPQDGGVILSEAAISHIGAREIRRSNPLSVTSMKQVGFMLVCKVKGVGVTLTFEKQQITSSKCAQCTSIWCEHVISAVLYRIQHAEKVRVFAPLTEVLHRLSRDQLHKLIQYTIADDPVSILGPLFERLDSVRDLNSKINAVRGAPDCTFGLGPEEVTLWDRSMEVFKNSFIRDIEKSDSWNYFPASYSETTYKDSRLYHYFHPVIEHINTGCIDNAGKLLICIGEVVGSLSNTCAHFGNSNQMQHFQWIVETFFTHFIIQFSGKIQKDVIHAAQDLNKTVKSCNISEYVRRPMLTVPDQDKMLPEDCRPDGAFYESLCAAFLPDPPEELQILLDGKASPADSCYDEPLPVMMLRLEGVGIWTKIDKGEEVNRKSVLISVVILRKLLKLTLKHSLLKENYLELQKECGQKHTGQRRRLDGKGETNTGTNIKKLKDLVSVEEDSAASTSTNIPTSSGRSGPKKRKGSKQRRKRPATDKDFQPQTSTVKKRKLSEGLDKSVRSMVLLGEPISRWNFETSLTDMWRDENEHTEVTLTYCLLHVVGTVYMSLYSTEPVTLDEASTEVVVTAGFRALEFDQHNPMAHRSYRDSRGDRELLEYYTETVSHDLGKRTIPSGVVDTSMTLYSQNILKQTVMMETGVSVVLIGLLVKRSPMLVDSSMELCSLVLQAIVDELGGSREYLRSSILQALKLLIINFFERANFTTDFDLFQLNKMFESLLECQSDSVLCEFTEELQKRIEEITHGLFTVKVGGGQATQICLAKFLVHFSVRFSDYSYRYSSLQPLDKISKLCSCVGRDFIDVLLQGWDNLKAVMADSQLLNLCQNMKSAFPPDSPRLKCLNGKVLSLVMNRAADSLTKETVAWLKYFDPESQEYTTAMELIRNGARGRPFVLLALAEVKYRHQNLSKTIKEPFSKETMDLIREALKIPIPDRIHWGENVHHPPGYCLNWIYATFTKHSPTMMKKSQQFKEFLDLFATAFKTNINEILGLLSAVMDSPLHELCSTKLGVTMQSAYEDSFVKCASYASSNTGYNRMIAELNQASTNFDKHHPEGQEVFKVLLQTIKMNVKRKKKCISLMEQAFGAIS